jgi:hypothetical protein
MRHTVLLLTAAILLVALPLVAEASDAYGVTIEVPTIFAEPVSFFAAYGEAVDNGLVCASGTVQDAKYIAAGRRDGGHWNFRVEKVFECADGSGSFVVNLKAHVYFDPYSDVGTWNVLQGTGAYAKMNGNGALSGTPLDGGVLDIYTGVIRSK